MNSAQIELFKSHHSKPPTQPQLEGLNKQYLKVDEERKRILKPYLSLLGDLHHAHVALVAPDSQTAILAPSQIPQEDAALFPEWEQLCSEEVELRMQHALQTLQNVRGACAVKALLLRGKSTVSHSQKKKTRAQGLVDNQTKTIEQGIASYSFSQKAYNQLGTLQGTLKKLPLLTPSDISNALSLLAADRTQLQEGKRTLPWFFRQPYCSDWDLDSDMHTLEGKSTQSACDSAEAYLVARLEWFRGRERWKRWEEELKLLKVDMIRTLRYIEHKQCQWVQQATVAQQSGGKATKGFEAYCYRQAHINQDQLECFVEPFEKCLKVSYTVYFAMIQSLAETRTNRIKLYK